MNTESVDGMERHHIHRQTINYDLCTYRKKTDEKGQDFLVGGRSRPLGSNLCVVVFLFLFLLLLLLMMMRKITTTIH
jgi:hypothetical protein